MMNFSNDSWIGKDKALHFVLNVFGGVALSLVAFDWTLSRIWTVAIVIITGLVINVGKELIDLKTTGFSYKDLAYGTLGNVLSLGILLL